MNYVEHAFKLTSINPLCGSTRWNQGYTVPKFWSKITCKKCKAKRKSKGR